jgi:hypothetical protein
VSNVAGLIDLSIAFTDTTSVETKTVAKTITLSESKEATGTAVKVAIISGTVGTASISIDLDSTTYRNASGDFVSFAGSAGVSRIALVSESSEGRVMLKDTDLQEISLVSYGGFLATSRWLSGDASIGLTVQNMGTGTADFTIVVTKE